MIGASTPFMIRSMHAGREQLADARHLALGKDADDLSVFQRLGCRAQEWINSRGRSWEEIGITPMILAKGFTSGWS